MKKLLKRALIGLGVVGFILAALTVLVFNKSTLGWQADSVPTGSMRPTMPPGSLVLAHRVPLSSLKVGDVITHTNPLTMRTTLTHRIVKEYKINGKIPAFVTKGDANPSPDPAFVGGLVQGKMVWHVPFAGRALMWAHTWTGIAVLVYLPALLIMIHETRLLAAYLRLKKPYRMEGSVHSRPPEPKPSMRPKWAMAASTAFAIVVAATGWQAAGALVSHSESTVLLDIPSNVIAAQAVPGRSPQNSNMNCVSTDVNSQVDQSVHAGTSTNHSTNCQTPENTSITQQQTAKSQPLSNATGKVTDN